MMCQVPYENLRPGPAGKYLAVIDYDTSNKVYYWPVDLDHPAILLGSGLDPSESDPQFHQQMVYAIASQTIDRFEQALGRKIRWSFNRWSSRDEADGVLRIYPHAMQEANAYYSRELRALVFGYFPASEMDPGDNLPGQTVFTCLSHDIIAHETTHALVDSQRDFFTEPTSADAPAFHEAFADLVALFQHFSFKEALLEMIKRTGGKIYRSSVEAEAAQSPDGPAISAELTTDNPMVGLAKQFGDAMGMRKALRSALGTPPNSRDLDHVTEPHVRGSILVAAVFDAFFSAYVRRTSDLMRIARSARLALDTADDLHPDLANRLAGIAAATAEHFLNICIRALDYCPPVDILFGDFLRAMITADSDLIPDDEHGYRAALIEAFRRRGIVPEWVTSYSEESLLWNSPEQDGLDSVPLCTGLQFEAFQSGTRKDRREQMQKNAVLLHEFATRHADALRLSSSEKIHARTFHEVHRVGPDGQLTFNVVAEFMQQREIPRFPHLRHGPKFTFRGGTTVILGPDGGLRYAVRKPVAADSESAVKRLARQREYHDYLEANLSFAPYVEDIQTGSQGMNFNMVHRGY